MDSALRLCHTALRLCHSALHLWHAAMNSALRLCHARGPAGPGRRAGARAATHGGDRLGHGHHRHRLCH
eukprot:442538-Prorocentrum_minimum.AAC.1